MQGKSAFTNQTKKTAGGSGRMLWVLAPHLFHSGGMKGATDHPWKILEVLDGYTLAYDNWKLTENQKQKKLS